MALTKCKECNHEISDQAQSCPSCGAPQKPKSKGVGLGGWILILFVAAVALVFFAAREGAEDQRRMQAALQLTGNYVGMTEGQLYELGTRLSNEGVGTVGEARETLFWLVCSGRFSSITVEPAARASLKLVAVQGLTPKEAVARLIPLTGAGSRDAFMACPK